MDLFLRNVRSTKLKSNRALVCLIFALTSLCPLGGYGIAKADTNTPENVISEKRYANSPDNKNTCSVLTKEDYVCGIIKLWAAVEHHFALMEYTGINWGNMLPEFLKKAPGLKTDKDYYCLLEEMLAMLKDNHTRFQYLPEHKGLCKPNLYIETINGEFFIGGWHNNSLASDVTIEKGDRIIAIDRQPIENLVEKIKPRIVASSETEKLRWAADRILWREKDKLLEFTIMKQGETSVVTLKADIPKNQQFSPFGLEFNYKYLENNLGYIRIPTFSDKTIPEKFKNVLNEFRNCKGIILDLRDNLGGNDLYAAEVAGNFIEEPIFFYKIEEAPISLSDIQEILDANVSNIQELTMIANPVTAELQYKGVLVILVNELTGSATEDFVMGLQDCGRAFVIGNKTSGGTGNGTKVTLPGGPVARICNSRITRLDGSRFHGIGVTPDLEVKRTVESIKDDNVLKTAINYILEKKVSLNSHISHDVTNTDN